MYAIGADERTIAHLLAASTPLLRYARSKLLRVSSLYEPHPSGMEVRVFLDHAKSPGFQLDSLHGADERT